MKRKNRIRDVLGRAFPKLEIVDATHSLTLFPSKADFDKAVRQDPRHCGFANCTARICGSTQAHFFKRYVYLDRLGEDGVRRVYRYVTSKSVFETLANFDMKRRIDIRRSFILRAPPRSQTIRAMRKANRKWRGSDIAKGIEAEAKARSTLSAAEREYQQALTLVERARETEKPSSPKMRDAQRRTEAAKTRVAKARVILDAKMTRLTKLREASPYTGTGKARVTQTDLNIRTGSGWFSRSASASAA